MSLCKACRDKRCHTNVEWRNHPLRGHGYSLETGWTHPDAQRLHEEDLLKAALTSWDLGAAAEAKKK